MENEQLVIRIKAGIDAAENMLQLWQQNTGIIGKLAGRYSVLAEEEDLKQEGYLALCEAVDHYNPEACGSFMHYAIYWIKQRMLRYGYNNSMVKIAVNERVKLNQYKRFTDSFVQETGRKPGRWEICQGMDIDERRLAHLEKTLRMEKTGSLEAVIGGEDEDITVGDTIAAPDDVEGEVLQVVLQDELKTAIWLLVDKLPKKQRQVLQMRYKEGLTQGEIGIRIGTSHQGAAEHERKGLRELRKPRNARILLPYLDRTPDTCYFLGCGITAFNHSWTSSTERVALDMYERNDSH